MNFFKYLFGKPSKKTQSNVPEKKNMRDEFDEQERMSANLAYEPPKTSVNEIYQNDSIKLSSLQNKEPKQAIIGFDFGSSCSKVIVNFNTYNKKIAINFNELGHKSNSFLLPTIIYIDTNGVFSLKKSYQSIMYKDFKTLLLTQPEVYCNEDLNIKNKDLAIAYLGLVLRFVKNQIYNSPDTPDKNIIWSFNLGVPSSSYKDNELKALFKSIALSAYYISESDEKVNKELLVKSENGIDLHTFIHAKKDDINVLSELAAEVIGFVQSDQRRDGLYVLIDIGSRTLDISSFNLNQKNGEDRFPFLTAEISEKGAFSLHKERISVSEGKMKSMNIKKLKMISIDDSVAPIVNINEYFESEDEITENDEIELLNEFFIKCYQFLFTTFYSLRKKRDPNSLNWVKGLPIFICGGGKDISFYNLIINKIESDYIVKQLHTKLIRNKIIIPGNIGYTYPDHDRMAVAHGLSYSYYDIGEIRPPEDFRDIPEIIKDQTKNTVNDVPILIDNDYL